MHRISNVARLVASGNIDFSRPFVVVTPHVACTELARDQLREFGRGRYTGLRYKHAVMKFGKKTDRYVQQDMLINAAELAALIASGKARDHDLYWAYYTSSNKDESLRLERTQAVEAFREIEAALSLSGNDGSTLTSAITLWAGPAGHVEYLHYDDESNLHLTVCGKKRWLLLPPVQVCKLNFVPVISAAIRHWMGWPESSIGPPKRGVTGGPASAAGDDFTLHGRHYFGGERLSNRNHPGHWSTCGGMEIVLNPGDALWVPAGWPHEVTGEDSPNSSADSGGQADPFGNSFVLSINSFYRAPRRAMWCCCCARANSGKSGLYGIFAWWAVFRLRVFHMVCGS